MKSDDKRTMLATYYTLSNDDTKGARQGEVQAIGHDTSTEKRQNYKQPLQMDPNRSKGKIISGGGHLQDLEPDLEHVGR